MSTSLDNWSQENKTTCFRHFAQELKEHSKQVFLRDKHHTEIFFLVSDDGRALVISSLPKMNRDELVKKLKLIIQEQNIYGVVHVVEDWTYFSKKPADHTAKQLLMGEIAVSELRGGDRTEALVVIMESREKAHFMWVTPILRNGDRVNLGAMPFGILNS
jgi:hypothetical protein